VRAWKSRYVPFLLWENALSMGRQDNILLLHAFPASLRDEAEPAISVLPANPYGVGNFTVRVNGEAVLIPKRVYYDPGSTPDSGVEGDGA
jgi:hypothetical protein